MNNTTVENILNTTNPNFARTTSALCYAKAVLEERAESFRKSDMEEVAQNVEKEIKLIKSLISERYGL